LPCSLNGQHSTDDLVSPNRGIRSANVIPFGDENAFGGVMNTQHPMSDQLARPSKDKHVPPPHVGTTVRHQHVIAILDKGPHTAAGDGDQVLPSSLFPYFQRCFENRSGQGSSIRFWHIHHLYSENDFDS
jgi:hypothetical protein